jgi:hypothetical protein
LLAAILGLITVIIERSGLADAPPSTTFVPTESGASEEGADKGDGGSTGEGGGPRESPQDPAHDGNSRSAAKELTANQPVAASLAAANDQDWYVYRAPEEETATVEVVPIEGERGSHILSVRLFEGFAEVAGSGDARPIEPFVEPRGVSAGTRLYVWVKDSCGDLGCSIGRYKVVVRTAPAG